jgi:hypothetical protein
MILILVFGFCPCSKYLSFAKVLNGLYIVKALRDRELAGLLVIHPETNRHKPSSKHELQVSILLHCIPYHAEHRNVSEILLNIVLIKIDSEVLPPPQRAARVNM